METIYTLRNREITSLAQEKIFYNDGKKVQYTIYRNGKKNGEYRTWYANGNPEVETFYVDDKRDGEYKTWYESGQLKAHMTYKNGKKMVNINLGMKTVN